MSGEGGDKGQGEGGDVWRVVRGVWGMIWSERGKGDMESEG